MIRICATGEWSQQQVTVETVPSTHSVPVDVQQAIGEAWEKASARPGVNLFDGPMVRWEGWKATPQRLVLRLSRTSYKAFLGTNMMNPQLDRALLANPVGLSAALTTVDDRLVLGRRNASVAYYPERIHPFAGALEPRDAANVFDGLRRELHEELALEAAELADIRCIGIVEDDALRQGELIFGVRTTLGHETLRSRVDQTEHRASVAIGREEIEAVLAQAEQLTPVCAGTVLLWGRWVMGEDWFEQTVARFGSHG